MGTCFSRFADFLPTSRHPARRRSHHDDSGDDTTDANDSSTGGPSQPSAPVTPRSNLLLRRRPLHRQILYVRAADRWLEHSFLVEHKCYLLDCETCRCQVMDDGDGDELCAICANPVRRLAYSDSCRHVFCHDCIAEYLWWSWRPPVAAKRRGYVRCPAAGAGCGGGGGCDAEFLMVVYPVPCGEPANQAFRRQRPTGSRYN